ncbi:MAG TPA: hypothetical protein VMU00_04730 [Steroidobacteraceae bacterium]|nr:hypothetical protein [Steroidobacteraceae bacterium]
MLGRTGLVRVPETLRPGIARRDVTTTLSAAGAALRPPWSGVPACWSGMAALTDIESSAALPASSAAPIIMASVWIFMVVLATRLDRRTVSLCAGSQHRTCNSCARAGIGLEHQRLAAFDKRVQGVASAQIVRKTDATPAAARERL